MPFLTDAGLLGADAELAVAEIGNGHSNLTFALTVVDADADADATSAHAAAAGAARPTRLVLRRPPRPPYAESAHDVLREARLLEHLHGRGVALPRVLATCADPEVIGVPFLIMEFVEGVAIDERLPAGVDPDGAAAIAEELIATLVALHAVDPALAGLGDPARADTYLPRQLRRFSAIWASEHTREIPDMDAVAAWLETHIPAAGRRAVVHGDFRLGNTLFGLHPRPQLTALLDWEMAALGDPLADLGYLMASWAQAGDPQTPISRLSAATRAPGFPTREGLRQAYEAASGTPTEGIAFYEVLATWKSAVFLEASYRRYRAGRAEDPYFAELEHGIPELAARARERANAA